MIHGNRIGEGGGVRMTVPLRYWPEAVVKMVAAAFRHPGTAATLTVQDGHIRIVPVTGAEADQPHTDSADQ